MAHLTLLLTTMRPEIEHEIRKKKAQLAEFLAARYVDQSLVLGFTTIVQSKFQEWVLEDVTSFSRLHSDAEVLKHQVDPDQFALIDLLQLLWMSFHYPIIKMYQSQHAELFEVLVNSLKKDSSDNGPNAKDPSAKDPIAKNSNVKKSNTKNTKKNGPTSKRLKNQSFKAVEMRKLNESFSKFLKSAKAFYNFFLREFSKYPNLLIPSDFLKEFDIVISHKSSSSSEFHSSLSYAIFYCLLGLGNLARAEATCTVNYAEPGKSVSAYYKHLKKSAASEKWKNDLYLFPMFCYFKCIGLLPTMHEPYNHLGVICNTLGQKFMAVFWFLRAQSTRDPNTAIPRYNLAAIFAKPWLQDAYLIAIQSSGRGMDPAGKNVILLRIIGDYFYPKAFQRLLYVQKVQADFLSYLKEGSSSTLVESSRLVIEQLTVLFSFSSLPNEEINSDFQRFVLQYALAYIGAIGSFGIQEDNIEGVLQVVRFILAFYRKHGSLRQDIKFSTNLLNALNLLIDFDTEETKARILEAFNENKPPIRTHYFDEDVHYKDYTPIGCQFKDFNDDHLFKSGNVDLLFGGSYFSKNQEIPVFLDNEAVNRLSKDAELTHHDSNSRQKAIAAECTRYENILRLRAIVVMVRKMFGPVIRLNAEQDAFEMEKPAIVKPHVLQDSNIKPKARKAKKREHKNVAEVGYAQASRLVPSSLEEMELMILSHAPKLPQKDVISEGDSANTVNAVVSEHEHSERPEVQVPASLEEILEAPNSAVFEADSGERHAVVSESDKSFDSRPSILPRSQRMNGEEHMEQVTGSMAYSEMPQYHQSMHSAPGSYQIGGQQGSYIGAYGAGPYMVPVKGMQQGGPGIAPYALQGYTMQAMGGPYSYAMMPGGYVYSQAVPVMNSQYTEEQKKQWPQNPNMMYMQYQ